MFAILCYCSKSCFICLVNFISFDFFFRMVVSNVESLVTSHVNVQMRVLPDREVDRLASSLMPCNFLLRPFHIYLGSYISCITEGAVLFAK